MAKGQMKANKEKKKPKAEGKAKPLSAYKAAQQQGPAAKPFGKAGKS